MTQVDFDQLSEKIPCYGSRSRIVELSLEGIELLGD
jgi:hypothetical protein